VFVDTGGKSGEDKARAVMEKIKVTEDLKDVRVVVRVRWSGCGVFPSYFDENTVLACTNYEEEGGDRS